MGSLRTIIERYHLERWFQRDNLIVLVLLGLLLVVIGVPVGDSGEKQEEKVEQEQHGNISEQMSVGAQVSEGESD